MCGDEGIDIRQVIDARSVFQVGGTGVLMAVTKTHQGLVGPWIVVQHRDLDDPGLQGTFGDRTGLGRPHRFKQDVWCDAVRVKTNLE